MTRTRGVLAASSVALIGGVAYSGALTNHTSSRIWLLVCAFFALLAAVQSVISEPRDLTPALLLSLPPLVAMALEGAPVWILALLGTLLFVGGELGALSWTWHKRATIRGLRLRRTLEVLKLGLVALGGSIAVGTVGSMPWMSGGFAIVVGATAIASLGLAVLRR